jgi:osmoprotectant transport system ATP-binding protein
MTAPVLALEGVSRSFAGKVAVHPLSLEIEAGRTTVLLGESGSGKSTLLRLMAGLITPDHGRVLFEGEPLTPKGAPILRRRMGFGLQSGGLFPHLTAGENVTLLARALGRPPRWRGERLEHLRTLVRLGPELLHRWPLELSGGQRQRVSLMRALMLEPTVVLLDEPLGALDPITRVELQAELDRVFAELHATVVLVTHDLAEAGALGDSVVLLREGRVVQQGTLETLVSRPADAWVARFLASPPGRGAG